MIIAIFPDVTTIAQVTSKISRLDRYCFFFTSQINERHVFSCLSPSSKTISQSKQNGTLQPGSEQIHLCSPNWSLCICRLYQNEARLWPDSCLGGLSFSSLLFCFWVLFTWLCRWSRPSHLWWWGCILFFFIWFLPCCGVRWGCLGRGYLDPYYFNQVLVYDGYRSNPAYSLYNN